MQRINGALESIGVIRAEYVKQRLTVSVFRNIFTARKSSFSLFQISGALLHLRQLIGWCLGPFAGKPFLYDSIYILLCKHLFSAAVVLRLSGCALLGDLLLSSVLIVFHSHNKNPPFYALGMAGFIKYQNGSRDIHGTSRKQVKEKGMGAAVTLFPMP